MSLPRRSCRRLPRRVGLARRRLQGAALALPVLRASEGAVVFLGGEFQLVEYGVLSFVPVDQEDRFAIPVEPEAGVEPGGLGVSIEPDDQVAAAGDGMMEPEVLADFVIEGLSEQRFLILPHPEVLTYMRRKTDDYDRWIGGMNRLMRRLTGTDS